jgi:putative tricarboxylic transport membrane protein
MEALVGLGHGFAQVLTGSNLYYCFLGSLVGTLIGVLPGIGPLAAMSLLLPATAALNPVASMSMLCALFYGAMYGGSTTSILVRIPGEAASVVTCLDGHEMAKKGRAGAALGMAAIGSFVAGTLSLVALTFFSPLLSEFALKFGPPENAALMLLGLVCTILLIEGSALRGLVMIALGAFLASIGQDSVTGIERFTFGSVNLVAGVDLIALVIGLFGISEILSNIETTLRNRIATGRLGRLLPTARDWRDSAAPMLRGSGLGFALGLIPGGGPVTASFMSYAVEKRLSRHPERFGTGEIAGLAGPEAANNSAVSAGMIPLLSLGLPGNAVTALLMGALIMQGVQPGPLFIVQKPDIFWGVVASMYIGNVFLLILNLPLVGLWVQLLRVPYHLLFPLIILLSLVGGYSANKNVFDLWMMLGFGVLGYVLRKLRYEMAPLILAFVLAPLLEQALRQSMVMSPDGAAIFLTRPVAMVLLGMVAALVAYVLFSRRRVQFQGGEI